MTLVVYLAFSSSALFSKHNGESYAAQKDGQNIWKVIPGLGWEWEAQRLEV